MLPFPCVAFFSNNAQGRERLCVLSKSATSGQEHQREKALGEEKKRSKKRRRHFLVTELAAAQGGKTKAEITPPFWRTGALASFWILRGIKEFTVKPSGNADPRGWRDLGPRAKEDAKRRPTASSKEKEKSSGLAEEGIRSCSLVFELSFALERPRWSSDESYSAVLSPPKRTVKKKETKRLFSREKQASKLLSPSSSTPCVFFFAPEGVENKKNSKNLKKKNSLQPKKNHAPVHSGTTTSLSFSHSLNPPFSISILTLLFPQIPARINS